MNSTLDRILTGDNLRLRGFDFVDWCIMCRCCGETMDHLLLYCGKAYRLWCFVFRLFGISWVLSCTMSDFLFSWWNCLGKHSSYIWNLVPLCLMWCIGRNAIGGRLRIWIGLRTKCLLSFLVPCLTGLGLGDSHLVTLFLFSLTLFLCNVFCFCSLLFFFVLLLRWCFLASSSFLNIFFLTYQKKMSRVMTYMLTWDRKPLHEEVQLNTSNWEENKREEERVPA